MQAENAEVMLEHVAELVSEIATLRRKLAEVEPVLAEVERIKKELLPLAMLVQEEEPVQGTDRVIPAGCRIIERFRAEILHLRSVSPRDRGNGAVQSAEPYAEVAH